MALDFPAAPTVGQIFAAPNSVNYQWTGTMWIAVGGVIAPSPGGDFCASGTGGSVGAAYTVVIPTTVLSGNAPTAYYSTSTGRWTPPAGRYVVFGWVYGAANSSAALGAGLHKNGVLIPNTSNANWAGAPTGGVTANVQVVVDANGSDYFDLRGACSVGASVAGMVFGAFPLSGIKGPPGDYPSGALFLYSEKVCVGGETFMDVTIPANTKRVELEWMTRPTSGSPTHNFQIVESGVPLAAANYSYQSMYGNGTTAGASGLLSQTSWGISGGSYEAVSVKFMPVPGFGWLGTLHQALIQVSRYYQAYELDCPATIAATTGFRITLASSSFLAGSFLRCYVVV